jgi:hypothetical protein
MTITQPTDHEFPITDEIRQLGFSKVLTMGKTLLVYNAEIDPIHCQYYKDDLSKTMNKLRKALTDSDEFDDKIICKFIVFLSQVWVKQVAAEDQAAKSISEGEKKQKDHIIEEVKELRAANLGITTEEWISGLTKRYDGLLKIVLDNIPDLWPGLEFELSVMRILNIDKCTLPFIGIILGRPASCKTQIISLLKKWPNSYYTDNFTARAFVSHSTSVSKEELEKIDMLPRLKNKTFLTPELSPMFTAKVEDLIQVLGIITRIADGQGFLSDSGAHGHRGYDEPIMFVWIGAAVDIPYNVYKVLGNLGAKLYFFRLSYRNRTMPDLVKQMGQDFNVKFDNIQSALFDYLKWFEIGPDLAYDESSRLSKMKWNWEQDNEQAKEWIADLAILLAHFRCVAKTWHTEDSEGSDYAYSVSQSEDPSRAATLLMNLAKGHALSTGRNYVTMEDVPIAAKTVLSTAQIERVGLFRLLISNGGNLNTTMIEKGLNVSKPTALRTMAEFKAIGLIDGEEELEGRNYLRCIHLKKQFGMFLSEDFQALCEGFEPIDNSEFMEEKEEDMTDKEKLPPYTLNFLALEKIDAFQRIFGEIELAAAKDPSILGSDKKTTVDGNKLRERLVSSGKFYQSDAAMLVEEMVKTGHIEQCGFDTYRRIEARK